MGGQRFPLWLGVAGLVVIVAYLGSTTGLLPADRLVLIAVFALGPVAVVGMLSIHERLGAGGPTLALRAGTVLLVIAFALFTLMVVVQQTVVLQFRGLRASADASDSELLKTIFIGVNFVQLGIDVAFDLFYCAGMSLVALVMFRHPDYGRLLGGFGMVSAVVLLALNLAAFPDVPGESGLIDVGPVTGMWWLWVIVQMIRNDRVARAKVAGTAPG
jgi:hypothetical protein